MANLFLTLFFFSVFGLILGLLDPSLFSKIVKRDLSRKHVGAFFGVAIILFFVLFGITAETPESTTPNKETAMQDKQKQEQKTEPQEPQKTQKEPAKPVSYKIVGQNDISTVYAGIKAKQKEYRVVLGTEVNKDQIRPTVEKIISELRAQDNDIDSIHLLLYSTENRADSAYDIGKADWVPGGDVSNMNREIAKENIRENYKIKLNIKDNLEKYLKNISQKETKLGLSESKRKEIWTELVKCEDKADIKASMRYDSMCSSCSEFIKADFKELSKKMDEFTKECEKNLRDKYDISQEKQDKISTEGATKNWPLPETPPFPSCCDY